MTASEPQPVDADELEAFDAACRLAFHEDARAEEIALDLKTLEPERTLAIRDGGEIVATAAIVSRELTVPGGLRPPIAGVTAVGVLPGHTRRGHLARLMRRQLDDVRAAGKEAIAVLWASEGGIYGRFGFGAASRSVRYEVELAGAALRAGAPRPAATPKLLPAAEAVAAIAPVYEAERLRRPGLLDRAGPWWERRVYFPEHRRDGAGELLAVLQPGARGEPEAYALYATTQRWGDRQLRVRELIATTPEARAALWRYLLGVDLMRTLEWELAPEGDPLAHLLADAYHLTHSVGGGLWVRLVELDRALAARAYLQPFALVLDVDDAFCPWNAGRHRLAFDGERARCEPTTEPAELAVSSEALGAAYLGGTSLESLAGAGLVRELRPGALELAAAAFRGVVEPWCPEIF